MSTILIILIVLIAAILYAFVIRPFLIHYYSHIQASAWLDAVRKKNTDKNKAKS
jgi:hypothetical protein